MSKEAEILRKAFMDASRPTRIFWDGKGRHPFDQSEAVDQYGVDQHGTYNDLGA